MVITKRPWGVLLTLLITLGLLGVTTSGAVATSDSPANNNGSSDSKSCAKDDVLTEKLYFMQDPFARSIGSSYRPGDFTKSGKYRYRNRVENNDRYRPEPYSFTPFDNDALGYSPDVKFGPFFDLTNWLSVAKPFLGKLYTNEYVYTDPGTYGVVWYIPTKEGVDKIPYSIKHATGVWCDAAIKNIRNVGVRNVTARALVNAIDLYNPNDVTVRVRVRNVKTGSQKTLTVKPKSSRIYRFGQDGNPSGSVDYQTLISMGGPKSDAMDIKGVSFRVRPLKTKSSPSTVVHKRSGTVQVSLVGAKKGTSTFRVTYKKKGMKQRKVVYKVKAKSSKTVTIKGLKKGSKVVVTAKPSGKKGYKTLKRVKL